jgi:hypothetical protein
LLKGVSKRAANYFEEALIRVFGKFCLIFLQFNPLLGENSNGIGQILNNIPPIRKQPDSLGMLTPI